MNQPQIIPTNAPPPPPQIVYSVQQPTQSNNSTLWILLGAVILMGVLIVGGVSLVDYSTAHNQSSDSPRPLSAREEATPKIGIQHWTWDKRNGDTFMTATFTITNGSRFDIKDITIKCSHTANSGTVIDSNTRTIYEIIGARQSRTFENFDMGFIHPQATSSSAEIKDFAVVEK